MIFHSRSRSFCANGLLRNDTFLSQNALLAPTMARFSWRALRSFITRVHVLDDASLECSERYWSTDSTPLSLLSSLRTVIRKAVTSSLQWLKSANLDNNSSSRGVLDVTSNLAVPSMICLRQCRRIWNTRSQLLG